MWKKATVVFIILAVMAGIWWFVFTPRSHPPVKDKDELAYAVLKTIKENDVDAFRSYFPAVLADGIPQNNFDTLFNFYKDLLWDESLPSFEDWQKYRVKTEFSNVDSIMEIAVPLLSKAATVPTGIIAMKINSKLEVTAIQYSMMPDASMVPEKDIPAKVDTFHITTGNLVSMRLYWTIGSDSIGQSKEYQRGSNGFAAAMENDVGDLFGLLDQSSITNAWKQSASSISNTFDLRALAFTFNDYGRPLTMHILKNGHDYDRMEIQMFYTMNAGYMYRVTLKDEKKMLDQLSTIFSKYSQ